MNRLFEMVYLLLGRKRMTAAELAEHFEVSTRTVFRDIEALSGAGIPVYATKGRGGGISLMDGFVLDKSLLNEVEQLDLLAALRSVDAVSFRQTKGTVAKLTALFNKNAEDWMEVDFSDWGGGGAELFGKIRSAILGERVVTFDYYNSRGERLIRIVEPVKLCFKSRAWYFYGYCRIKSAMRMFKLSRVRNLIVTTQVFDKGAHLPSEKPDKPVSSGAPHTPLKLKISKAMAYRVYDEFREGEIIGNAEDGDFIVAIDYGEDEWMYGFLLSFGHFLEVIEPKHIRGVLIERLNKTIEKYNPVS